MRRAMLVVFAVAGVLSLGTVPPVLAIDDTKQVISGGVSSLPLANGALIWTAPGLGSGIPEVSGGEAAVLMPFPAGTLSNLKARVWTPSPATGTVVFRLRVNQVGSGVSCTITMTAQQTGTCTANVAQAIVDGDLVALKLNQTLTGPTTLSFSYTLQFD